MDYWPKELFTYLNHSAILVHWAGDVYSINVKKKPHTKTQMGSGDFARSLYGFASYIKNIRIMDYSHKLKYPKWVYTSTDEEECYTSYNYIRYGVEPEYFFGGPGGNYPRCE